MIFNSLPSLPSGFKNGFSAVINDVLYVGLGSLGSRCFTLQLSDKEATWQSCKNFPYGNIESPVSVQCGNSIWLFGGVVNDQMNDKVYQYDPNDSAWVSYDSPCPVGLLGSVAHAISDKEIVFIGGYNKQIFDDINYRLSSSQPENKHLILYEFLSKPIEYYQWNRIVWVFNTEYKTWTAIGNNPNYATCGSAPIEFNGELWLVDGEIKPGLRVAQVSAFDLAEGFKKSRNVESILRLDREHEGLAGAFSGLVNGQPVICGGAYFIGSRENFKQGNLYAHKGLSKTYCCNTWTWKYCSWQQLDNLPLGLAYGCSEEYQDHMLIIGGEKQDGSASDLCFEVKLS